VKQAVFLDRDGVITQEPPHYAYQLKQLKLIPGSAEAIRSLNENDFAVIMVSNQAGIARGYYGEDDAARFNQALARKLAKKGARIDAIYICPHHPEAVIEKYRLECDCRKPKPGMLKTAEKELELDLEQSFMVGDKSIDIEAGKRAGCRTILVKTGFGSEEIQRNSIECNYIAEDLFEAAERILCLANKRGKGA
jgi:D-glycero-D-manno-heptose 1,7-bisphosphate phosphatase